MLEKLQGNGLGWVIVRLPFSVEKVWGSRNVRRVRLEVNGFEYRTALFPTRSGEHFVLINKKMQKAVGIRLGSVAEFVLTPDLAPRELTLPRELERALNQDRGMREWFDRLNASIRRWIAKFVADAKAGDTRRRRAERIAEQVLETMEAELELPPIMRLAFSRNPGAERMWREMTETQRRNHLFSIFHYRTPRSRMNRIEKMIEQLRG